jgi:indole-3-glycerol phosphate synthase
MNWLSEHLAFRRRETAARRAQRPEEFLREGLGDFVPIRNFSNALKACGPAVIAEIKFRSPSKGSLRAQADVEVLASAYHRAGASALSVLVDGRHFGGDWSFLARARRACPLPLLAKGFFVEPYDLLEARAAGADAALLIARAFSRSELAAMLKAARELGLGTLTELHGGADLASVEGLELDAVGVNHRDLETLRMDSSLGEGMAKRLPSRCPKVAESGLKGPSDLVRMAALGYDAVLVGSAFMEKPDPGAALAQWLEACHACR